MGITGIGKTVSALKKRYGDSEIATVARDLVTKWKAAVDEEDRVGERASAEEENAPENDNEADIDNDSPVPEYNPTPIDQLENGREDSEQEPENEEESSQEDDHHNRKSKKKKSDHTNTNIVIKIKIESLKVTAKVIKTKRNIKVLNLLIEIKVVLMMILKPK